LTPRSMKTWCPFWLAQAETPVLLVKVLKAIFVAIS
jgi:hypothetical protein